MSTIQHSSRYSTVHSLTPQLYLVDLLPSLDGYVITRQTCNLELQLQLQLHSCRALLCLKASGWLDHIHRCGNQISPIKNRSEDPIVLWSYQTAHSYSGCRDGASVVSAIAAQLYDMSGQSSTEQDQVDPERAPLLPGRRDTEDAPPSRSRVKKTAAWFARHAVLIVIGLLLIAVIAILFTFMKRQPSPALLQT